MPNPASVPRTRLTGITKAATIREFLSAATTSGSRKICWYHVSVKPLNGSVTMIELLKENSTSTTSGR